MKREEFYLYIAILVFLFATTGVCADNALNFYPQNSAKTIFVDQGKATNSPEIGYFESKNKKAEIAAIAATIQIKTSENQSSQKQNDKELPKTKDAIAKMYGDPEAEVIVPGREDAPGPFRAMMASLEMGDAELAQKYAQQYVKYLKSVQTRTDSVMALVNKAMTSEGMLKKENVENDDSIDIAKLSEAQNTENFDEEKARKDIRSALKGTVPQDPFGEVDIYFFFQMDDENSRLMLPEIRTFYESIKDNSKIKFIALSLDNASREDIKEYSDTFDIKFPIRGGMTLAKKLNVSAVPMTLIMTHNSPQKVVVEKGFRRSFYLEEVANLMVGKGESGE